MPDEQPTNGDATPTAEATAAPAGNGEGMSKQTRTRGPDRKPRKRRGPVPQIEEFRSKLAHYVADLLGRGANAHEAAAVVRRAYAESALFGKECSPPTTAAVIAMARTIIIERTGRSREEHLRDSFAFYTQIVRDPETSTSEKLRARAALDSLLGLHGAGPGPEGGGEPEPVRITEMVVRTRADVDLIRRAERINGLHLVEECLERLEAAARDRPHGTLDGRPPTSTID
jgi:hypothetical protein